MLYGPDGQIVSSRTEERKSQQKDFDRRLAAALEDNNGVYFPVEFIRGLKEQYDRAKAEMAHAKRDGQESEVIRRAGLL